MQDNTMPTFGAPATPEVPPTPQAPTTSNQPDFGAPAPAPVANSTPAMPNLPEAQTTQTAPITPETPETMPNMPFAEQTYTDPTYANQAQPSPIVEPEPAPLTQPAEFLGMNQQQPPMFQDEKEIKTGKNNIFVILTVIFGVTTIAAGVLAAYFGINMKSAQKTTTPVATQQTADISTGVDSVLGFYPEDITNPADDATYRIGDHHRLNKQGNSVFGVFLSSDNASAEVYVYWQYVKDYYGVDTSKNERETFTLTFDQAIADVYVGESGQTVAGDVLLILLEDGTVEYMPVVQALKTGKFASSGQLGGVTNITKFYRADVSGDFSGYVTTLAQRTDGTIVDLGTLLTAATNISSQQ